MKSGNLNFLEPSGPLQACNGTDLPFRSVGVIIAIFIFGSEPARNGISISRNRANRDVQKVHSKKGS